MADAPHPSGARKKKRGGQPGNRNALRHGFYARSLPPAVAWDYPSQRVQFDSLQSEIDALQVLIARISALLDTPDPDLKNPHAPLNAVLNASREIDSLQKKHHQLQNYTLKMEYEAEQMRVYKKTRETHPTELLTTKNLEALLLKLYPNALPFKDYLSPEDLEKYNALREFQEKWDAFSEEEEPLP